MHVRIDVFADVVCPWCYIGEHRLAQAIAERPELEVAWQWRPFQLQPQLPPAGMPWAEFVNVKFGGLSRAQAAFSHVASVGAVEGLRFDFNKVAGAPNTTDAHRIILLAQEQGIGRHVATALFRGYFAEGADLGDHQQLVALAATAGLNADAARQRLEGSEGLREVRESQVAAHRMEISGVPFFIFNGKYLLSGAQPQEVFDAVLDRLLHVPAS